MNRRTTALAAATGLASLAVVGVHAPAQAATTGDTNVTFAITSGNGLAITAPTSTTLTDKTAGSTSTTGTLSGVHVTDGRGALVATWSATVSSTDFVNQTDTSKTIPKANLTYSVLPGAITTALGTGLPVFVPGVFGVSAPGVTYAGVGSSDVSWDAGLNLTIPATAPVGTYAATITHSVS
jgi:hypothetical protein